jgi:hypothetical protein
MALSLGDLGVIALFGSEQVLTLPLLLAAAHERATAPPMPQAWRGLLALMCLGLIWTADAAVRSGEALTMAGAALELDHVWFHYEDMDYGLRHGRSGGRAHRPHRTVGSRQNHDPQPDRRFRERGAQAGAIRIDGRDVSDLPAAMRPVTMVFQEHNLFAHLDVGNQCRSRRFSGLATETCRSPPRR